MMQPIIRSAYEIVREMKFLLWFTGGFIVLDIFIRGSAGAIGRLEIISLYALLPIVVVKIVIRLTKRKNTKQDEADPYFPYYMMLLSMVVAFS